MAWPLCGGVARWGRLHPGHNPSAVMARRDPAIHSMLRRVGGIGWAPGSSPGVTRRVGIGSGRLGRGVAGQWTGWGRAWGMVRAVDTGVRRYDGGGWGAWHRGVVL